MDSKKSTYQSRILREMRNQAERPFSPPASTGSHGTVTLTSQLSIPDGESTRQPMLPIINTSVLGRTFPEWKHHGKENKQPSPQPSPQPAVNYDNSDIFMQNSPRLHARQMRIPVIENTMEFDPPLNPPRGNLTTLLDTLQTARADKAQADERSMKQSSQISPKSQLNSGLSANVARRLNRQSYPNDHNVQSPSMVNQTAHSFFLPNLNHLHDLVSGTLRWSSMKNGMPIFVKHGKVHDKETKRHQDRHADFEVVTISEEEERIFVSLDKIRDEIQTLQEHDEFVSKQAEQLQDEVCELQSHVTKLQSRKDSAVGSEFDSSLIVQLTHHNTELEEQVSSLKSRLDQANRQISLNEIHNQSFAAERDEALQRASDHLTTIKRLQTRNDAITQQKLDLQQALKGAEEDLISDRALLESLHQKYEMVSEEKRLLKEDSRGLERHNEDLFNNNKLLQQNNSLLERENNNLQNKAAQLQDTVDELNKNMSQKSEATRSTQQPRGIMSGLSQSKLTKMTQNWESEDRFTVVSEASAKTRPSQMRLPKHDDTRESDFTRESRHRYTQESKGSMPVTGKSKLTKLAHQEPGDRYTVVSEMSAKTTSHTDLQMQDDYTQQIDFTREPQLDSDQENMTSALFIDDITLDSTRKSTRKQKTKGTPAVRVLSPVLSIAEPSTQTQQTTMGKQKEKVTPPVLTQSAKRVLNNLCYDHECYNCMVCARIQSHRHEANGKCGKKTVRVDRPVPVTDRVKSRSSTSAYDHEEQSTLRPSQDPAIALAKVVKGLKDEERHIRTAMARKQAVYDECDAAVNKKLWKKLDAEIRALRQRRDLKRDQIYDLHDVLEGQKANAQLMNEEAIDMTIMSVLSKDPTWNGIMEF
ncbi:hypothetical protein F4782DRAFT_503303 [Xylaria castorea]|nr:hypothetical protein F4782DRAFT_503303 [Xylaria castorea]